MGKKWLLKSQKNDIALMIQKMGFSLSDFGFDFVHSGENSDLFVEMLRYKQGNFYFLFDEGRTGGNWYSFSPGKNNMVEIVIPGDWSLTLTYISKWLGYLKREIEAPDLWNSVIPERALINAVDKIDSEDCLSHDERKQIAESLNEIKQYITTTYELTSERLEFLDKRIAYLTESSERLGKKDFINMAVGVITNIILGIAFSGEQANQIYQFALLSLSFLWKGQPVFLP